MDVTITANVFASALSVALLLWYQLRSEEHRAKVHRSMLTGSFFVDEILNGHERVSFDLLRMSENSFLLLANELKRRCLLNDSRWLNVEEQISIFLFTIGHHQKNRVMQNRFQHSGQTISKHFNATLNAILKLEKYYLKQSDGEYAIEITNNSIFYPYFKDCVGAIDGTHIPAFVRILDQPRYRNRKGFLSQNVMVVVSFDMSFQYVYAGWEGFTSDSKVLHDAVWRRSSNRLIVPEGKYYLVDAGYANTRGFLAPYRSTRYHLKEWSTAGNAPASPKELFNLRHSRLRNIVKRSFAVLKERFKILTTAPRYPIQTQAKIVVACYILHNFIRKWKFEDEIFDNPDTEIMEEDNDDMQQPRVNILGPNEIDRNYMVEFRESLAEQMWLSRVEN